MGFLITDIFVKYALAESRGQEGAEKCAADVVGTYRAS